MLISEAVNCRLARRSYLRTIMLKMSAANVRCVTIAWCAPQNIRMRLARALVCFEQKLDLHLDLPIRSALRMHDIIQNFETGIDRKPVHPKQPANAAS